MSRAIDLMRRLGAAAGAFPSRERWRRASFQDRLAICLLALIPVVGLGGPALWGHAILAGDNLYQNFPLRVFVGTILRAGHLPLWNRDLWSGTPLLGGFNAGAAYPGTFLFAFLPPLIAWTLNAVGLYLVAGIGMYALLREHRLTPLAAALGAGAATFAGFMPAQFVHIALVQGMSWAPWVVLALERLGTKREHRWAYWILLCFAGGMVPLAGEPRAVDSVAILALVYLIGLAPRAPLREQLLWGTAAAAPVIFALGAAQLLPGLPFVATSQRAQMDYGWFAQSPNLELLPRLIWPFFSMPHALWNYPYWDTEAWGYVGVLPFVAIFTYPFWRKQARGRPATWLALAIVGLILSLAGVTRLGHLLYHVPLYGPQRGQSRNLALVDLGLAGLFACWADDWITNPQYQLARVKRWLRLGLSLVPPLCLASVALIAHRAGPYRSSLFGVPKRAFLVAPSLGIAAAYVVLLLCRRLRWEARAALLAAVVVVDLTLALSHLEMGRLPIEPFFFSTPTSDMIAQVVGPTGRFGNIDSKMYVHSFLGSQLTPDLPLLLNLRSVEGLGSAVDGQYDAATESHSWRNISAAALDGDTVDELDLKYLLIPTRAFQARKPLGLEHILAPPHWVESGQLDSYRTFVNKRARGRVWLEAVSDDLVQVPEQPAAGTATVSSIDDQDGETDMVSADGPALLVRSVAYGDGWRATLRDTSGSSRTVPALRHHVVQAVEVPAGQWTVTWSYDPPGARLGLGLSAAAALGLAALGLGLLVARQRTRRSVGITPAPLTPDLTAAAPPR